MSYIDKKIAEGNFSPELREILQSLSKEMNSFKTRLSSLEQEVVRVQDASRSAQNDP